MSQADLPEPADDLPAEQIQLSPLSIQAASLVRSVDALSNIFWISIGGAVLSVFFAALAGLDANASTDYVFLGEYQVPKSILPVATFTFAMFAFWMTANRLNMLAHVLHTTRLPRAMVHEIFHLNPPVLNIFDRENTRRWSPLTGVSVFLITWSMFFGNSIGITLGIAFQEGASFAEFDFPVLGLYLVVILAVMVYGVRVVFPPLRKILNALHGVNFHVGWPRPTMAVIATIVIVFFHIGDALSTSTTQSNNLLGPEVANAMDGQTLFMMGLEVSLFGIDAVEREQHCQNAEGDDYRCGLAAAHALQRLIDTENVICLPIFSVDEKQVVADCEIMPRDTPAPASRSDFSRIADPARNLSRLMVAQGHAVAVGIGVQVFGAEQIAAQKARRGIWQGTFVPPASWRSER